jgi:subtilisin family serine protease
MSNKYFTILVTFILLIIIFPSLNGSLLRKNQQNDIQSNLITTPNDTFFSQQWALQNTGQTGGTSDCDIDAIEAWDIEKGNSDVIIAIIDSGIDYNHPDLSENVWINEDEIPDNDIDDDQNGYVDDYMGYDFTDSAIDSYPLDGNGHGTVMSGAAAAVTNNNVGIAGVAWNCKIMPVKIADENWYADVINIAEGIRYAADNGAKVICMAFSARSSAIKEAVNYAYGKGVFLCCAAGNYGNSIKQYPAAYDNVTAVAATDHNDQRMDYTYEFNGVRVVSSYGSWVDIASPGQEIHTTSPTYHVVACDTWGQELNYDIISGTTLATPILAGVAALVFSKNPNLSSDEVKDILCGSVDPYDSEYYLGSGRVNAYKALTAPEKPEKPTGPTKGKTGVTYMFSTKTNDIEGEQVYYIWDWGDGNFSEWLGPYNSEELIETEYSWEQENNFNIRIKAKDVNGGCSPWSEPLPFSTPKNKGINIMLLFQRFMRQYLILYQILQGF